MAQRRLREVDCWPARVRLPDFGDRRDEAKVADFEAYHENPGGRRSTGAHGVRRINEES